MKTGTNYLRRIKLLLATAALAVPLAGSAQIWPWWYIPERFGVINITPNNLSGESAQNSEPSLGVGTGSKYGKMVAHAFPEDYYYTSSSSGGPPWVVPGTIVDYDATLDWSSGGNCYIALMPGLSSINIRKSTDPATIPFANIPAGTVTGSPDQPWVKVVNVSGVDHIFVGFNDLNRYPGRTASVHYSLDGGTTWNTTVVEKVNPGTGWDSPAVRLAMSPNGQTIYAMFQRANSFVGATFGSDYTGDVVFTRDDNFGGSGFSALGGGGVGTLVAHNIRLPWSGGTSLGAQRLGGECDVACNPWTPSQVYVAYTEVVSGVPVIRVQSSANSGATFNLVYSINNASLPALAVTLDGTVGLLYALINNNNIEVHFLKAFNGNFATINERVLAKFPNNNPVRAWSPYIGDYFTLRASGYNFFGTFSASGDPQPSHFPCGVYYQRNVNVGGIVKNNFWLTSPGTLVNLGNQAVAPSIDPYVFYDLAPIFRWWWYIYLIHPFWYDPGDPFAGIIHLGWPVLPSSQPQFQLLSSPVLGAGANWGPATNSTILQTNGQFVASFGGPGSQQYYKLHQNIAGAQFHLYTAAGSHGSLSPNGVVTNNALGSQTFFATASNNYVVSKWYVDGVVAQSSGSSLTLSNIADEHTIVATFVPSNDLAVTVAELALDDGPTVTFSTNQYVINVENQGLSLLTGITMSNRLDASVSFLSATTTQGTVNNSGNQVTASLGSLSPGASATITITFVPSQSGSVTDVVDVACAQLEPDLSNNHAIDVTPVIDPVAVTNNPASQSVTNGGTVCFTVEVSGTPPFTYQWYFNGTPIPGATGSTYCVTNATPADAGSYSVTVWQILGPEDIIEATSAPATLSVGPIIVPEPPAAIVPIRGQVRRR